jgi:glyoxylase-like metal-dependent hydrolase (beta-lactamase superfamily II)
VRLRLALVATLIAVEILGSPTVVHSGRRRPAPPPVGPVSQLAPNLYLVPAGGCNTAVWVTRRGIVVVDTKYPESWPDLAERVRSISAAPITHVINTHHHADHAGGNVALPPGIRVVLHREAARALERPHAGAPSGASPQLGSNPILFDTTLTLFEGDEAIDLYHFGPAHTAGDAVVVFRSARHMSAGDIMPGLRLPTIVLEGGGSGATFATVLDRAASLPGVDHVITGNGPVVTRQVLADYAELNRRIVEHVRARMSLGVDKDAVFRSFQAPDHLRHFDLGRAYATMDEIDRSLRPWWQRLF